MVLARDLLLYSILRTVMVASQEDRIRSQSHQSSMSLGCFLNTWLHRACHQQLITIRFSKKLEQGMDEVLILLRDLLLGKLVLMPLLYTEVCKEERSSNKQR